MSRHSVDLLPGSSFSDVEKFIRNCEAEISDRQRRVSERKAELLPPDAPTLPLPMFPKNGDIPDSLARVLSTPRRGFTMTGVPSSRLSPKRNCVEILAALRGLLKLRADWLAWELASVEVIRAAADQHTDSQRAAALEIWEILRDR